MRIARSQSSIVSKTQESAFVPRYFTPWNVTFEDCKYIFPYQIDRKIVNNHRGKYELLKAFEKLESNSSLKFVEQTDQERYLYFVDGHDCKSYIGPQKQMGPQNITLGPNCLHYYTIIHQVEHINISKKALDHNLRFCTASDSGMNINVLIEMSLLKC